MTYCCGVLVRDGLVMIADTRTNAGLDNISTFRKLHVFSKPGERIMAIASAGNLALTQSVISTLSEGLPNPDTGELETLMKEKGVRTICVHGDNPHAVEFVGDLWVALEKKSIILASF